MLTIFSVLLAPHATQPKLGQTIRASSATATGSYVREAVQFPIWSHEVDVVSAPTGQYVKVNTGPPTRSTCSRYLDATSEEGAVLKTRACVCVAEVPGVEGGERDNPTCLTKPPPAIHPSAPSRARGGRRAS